MFHIETKQLTIQGVLGSGKGFVSLTATDYLNHPMTRRIPEWVVCKKVSKASEDSGKSKVNFDNALGLSSKGVWQLIRGSK